MMCIAYLFAVREFGFLDTKIWLVEDMLIGEGEITGVGVRWCDVVKFKILYQAAG